MTHLFDWRYVLCYTFRMEDRVCVVCGKTYTPYNPRQKTCSPDCSRRRANWRTRRWNKANQPKCVQCGKPHGNASHTVKSRPLCQSCYLKSCQGPLNHAWKGGRRHKGNGYIEIYAPGHHRAHRKYVLEHIFVWEKANGKQLPEGWVIHHLNGIKNDNRAVNLVAMPLKKHHSQLVNQVLKERIRELESQLGIKPPNPEPPL